MHSIAKCAVRRTPLWLRLWFYFIQGFTNALWKSSVSMAKCGMNLFLLSSIILHWLKALWILRAFVNCGMVLKNTPISSFFIGRRWTKCAMNILRSYLNWWHNWQLKNRRCLCSHALKGSHSTGDGRIFLKSRRDTSFNKDLSNEPTFGRIQLAGQYLSKVLVYLYSPDFTTFLKHCHRGRIFFINKGILCYAKCSTVCNPPIG